jgi:ribosomal protein S6
MEEQTSQVSDKYDITFVVSENEKSEFIEKAIGDSGSKPLKTTDLGTKQFAYPIKKLTIGRYFVAQIEATPESLKKLNDELKHESSIIRYLVVKSLRFPEKRPPKEETARKEVPTDKVTGEKQTIIQDRPVKIETKDQEEKTKEEPKEAVQKVVEKKPVVKEEKEIKKAPARKKPVKISADELDKKLEELVED